MTPGAREPAFVRARGGLAALSILLVPEVVSAAPATTDPARAPEVARARLGYYFEGAARAALLSDEVSQEFDSPPLSLLGLAFGFGVGLRPFRLGFELEALGPTGNVRLVDGGVLTGTTVDATFVSASMVWSGSIPLGRFDLQPSLVLGLVADGAGNEIRVTDGPASDGFYVYEASSAVRAGLRVSALYWFGSGKGGIAPLLSLGIDGRSLMIERHDDTGAVHRHKGFLGELSLRVGAAVGVVP